MPEIISAADEVNVIFNRLAQERGLDPEATPIPAAVAMAFRTFEVAIIQQFYPLLSELPADARAWDWVSVCLSAWAEKASGAIVLDTPLTGGDDFAGGSETGGN